MSFLEFFAGSGVLAWLYLGWRSAQILRGLPRRLYWALWGYRQKEVHRP